MFGLAHGVHDFAAEVVAEGVELFGAVEGDVGESIVGFVENVAVVGNGWLLGVRCAS